MSSVLAATLLFFGLTSAGPIVVQNAPAPALSPSIDTSYAQQQKTTKAVASQPPQIYSLHVTSHILSRFANTLVTSRLANRENVAKEAIFVVQLPDAAFISNFTMEIDNQLIVGEVKEKEQARQAYNAAKALGQSAGHVAQAPRETNTFHISVNVAAFGKVTFNLTYQEMLGRSHGVYKHTVNVQPGQVVDDLKVDVFITEFNEISRIFVPEFGEKIGQQANQDLLKQVQAQDVSVQQNIGPELSQVRVSYNPKPQKQKKMQKHEGKGLSGQLVVLYDVKRQADGGELQLVNGYFVHFFAPSDLPVSNKHVIFVLDNSGSMSGRKIQQTKEAMGVILNDLSEMDVFNVFEFDDCVRLWKNDSVPATKEHIASAAVFVNGLYGRGGTNINLGLQFGLEKLLRSEDSNENRVIIFLTDGQASSGVTGTDQILSNVRDVNQEDLVTIHSISFGDGADFSLLKKLSLQNNGIARKVYEDSDAALQLQGFYAEISSLLLRDVDIRYVNETVELDSIVKKNDYDSYYDGCEVVTVGKLIQNIHGWQFHAAIEAIAADGARKFTTTPACQNDVYPFSGCLGPVQYEPLPADTLGAYVERTWAYLSIKKMLEKSKYDSQANATELRQKALELSLKYNFVTELTSMVVIQPNSNSSQALAQGEPTSDYGAPSYGASAGGAYGGGYGGYGAAQAQGYGQAPQAAYAPQPQPAYGAAQAQGYAAPSASYGQAQQAAAYQPVSYGAPAPAPQPQPAYLAPTAHRRPSFIAPNAGYGPPIEYNNPNRLEFCHDIFKEESRAYVDPYGYGGAPSPYIPAPPPPPQQTVINRPPPQPPVQPVLTPSVISNPIQPTIRVNNTVQPQRAPVAAYGSQPIQGIPGGLSSPPVQPQIQIYNPPPRPQLPVAASRHSYAAASNSQSQVKVVQCVANMTYDNSSNPACNWFCGQSRPPRCKNYGPKCICSPGYVQAPNGQCVMPLDCPNVPKSCIDPNAEVTACGAACPQETCADPLAPLTAHCTKCGPPACVCKQGFVLTETGRNGSCVPRSYCV